MRNLIDFSRTSEFSGFMRGLENIDGAEQIIHGVFVEYHPLWRQFADYYMATGVEAQGPRRYAMPFPGIVAYGHSAHLGPYNQDYLPEAWEDVCYRGGKSRAPFLTKIYVTPTTDRTLRIRRSLEAYARTAPFFVVVIDAPVGVLAAQIEGGQELIATLHGTVGGYLADQYQQVWGVTCGHVAQAANAMITLSDVKGATIPNGGTTVYTNFSQFVAQPIGAQCNPYVGGQGLSVDAALFAPAAGHTPLPSVQSIGTIDRIYGKADLSSGSLVAMRGAVSGRADYEIGGYGVTAKFQLAGTQNFYCFTDLFDFFSPGSSNFFPPRMQQSVVPWPLQGDSGAWLCHNHAPGLYGYFGSLIAVRGPVGIAIFAESVCDWAMTTHQLTLSPI